MLMSNIIIFGMKDERFFPKGAIAFLVALTLLYAALWFVAYWDVIVRRLGGGMGHG